MDRAFLQEVVMFRIIALSLALSLALVLALAGCSSLTGPHVVMGTGTVSYVNLEGGFYGIVADNGARLDPSNLPEVFRVNGLYVHYRGYFVPGGATSHMWGAAVTLTDVKALPTR
jgi:hypothetical protein